MNDIVRVLRVLEYVGPRLWVEQTIEKNAVKVIHRLSNGAYIKEAYLGQFPEVIEVKES